MGLGAGARLGAYEITATLGAGGMGEVYRARDTKLGRDVAIKVLPDGFAADPDRRARFEREAQTLASLNHPNIAQIFGVLEHPTALVMECVEGEDLAQRLARGPIALDDALPIVRQIIDALEAAHEQGIVHRDLKPANIKIRPDGAVKVLDFGLAKAMGASSAVTQNDAMLSPTFTSPIAMTQMGMIVGTAAYMAPEQARGRAVDKRADIWAFGVIVYEMLTGARIFAAESIPETLGLIFAREADLNALPSGTPAKIRRLLARCLVKDPKQRLRDIGDARVMLDEPEEQRAPAVVPPLAPRPPRRIVALAVVALPLIAAAAAWSLKPVKASPTLHLSIALPAGEQVTSAPAISLDGQTIGYVAGRSASTSHLYVRRLDAPTAQQVDSSVGATDPFFSPDGKSVAFFAAGKLWRAAVGGGTATIVAATPRPWGGAWGADGRIIYVPSLNGGIWRVAADGGSPEQLTQPDDGEKGYAHVYPQILPNGDILFTFWGRSFYIAQLSPATTVWHPITPPGRESRVGIYVHSGYLLQGDQSSNVRAAAWTPSTAGPVHAETIVLDGINWIPGTEQSWLAVSANGTVVSAPGNPDRRHLAWIDRQGTITELSGDAEQITHATLSRDGRRVVYNGRNTEWVRDLITGTKTRISSGQKNWTGGWMPDDDRIVISSNKTGDWDLYTIGSAGGDLKPLLTRPRTQHPLAVGPDGSVFFLDSGATTTNDVMKLSPDGKITLIAATPAVESQAAISADGRYVAYVSDQSGRNEVYATSSTGEGQPMIVSVDGGTGPAWSHDGRELFYRAGDDLISVAVLSTSPLALGERRRLLDVSGFEPMYFHDFDVSPDGQRFLFIRSEPDARPTRLDVIVNWFPELQHRLSAGAGE